MSDRKASPGALLKAGVLGGNPLLRLGLGLCPAVAVAATGADGLAMGVVTACVLICASFLTALVGKVVSEKGRLPVAVLISAALAAFAQMLLKGWMPEVSRSLGLFAPLTAVCSLILCRAVFAAEQGPVAALADGFGMGIGYVLAMTLLGVVRELIGNGTAFGAAVLPAGYQPMVLMSLPAGGFLALGLLMGLFNAVAAKGRNKEASK